MHRIIVIRKSGGADWTSSLAGPSIDETSPFCTSVAEDVSGSISGCAY